MNKNHFLFTVVIFTVHKQPVEQTGDCIPVHGSASHAFDGKGSKF